LLFGVAIDRLLVGGFGLIHGALIFMQGVGGLVEPRLRSIAVLRELADAVVCLLRQHHAGLRPLERRLARFDHLGARADIDVRELCLGDNFGRQRLLVLAMVSGLSIRTNTAPAATFCPRKTGISPTRPSTRAAMSSRVASTSPCTSSGWGRTRYQIDRL